MPWNDDERFHHHEPCPKCGSRDNLGVWDDGHKWCFGCGFYLPSPTSLDNLKKKAAMLENNNKNGNVAAVDTSGFTSVIPPTPLAWLKKYGITHNEISYYGILWNELKDRLVFPLRDDLGIIFTTERYFGPKPDYPKYVTYGQKATNTIYFANKNTPQSLVIVEDFVSAIKVARFANCLPIFGSTISANSLKWIMAWFKCIRIWLDMDKAAESLQQASRLSQFVANTRSIITEFDPKEYSNNSLILTLKESGIS